jgi:hypothetical protein
MPKQSSWYNRAAKQGLDAAATKRYVDAGDPFGPRTNPGGDASDMFVQHLARMAEEPQC